MMSTLKDHKNFAFTGTKSSIASSSSSTTDFDDLLPDLWQTSSNESDMKHSSQSLFNSPHHYLFQQDILPSIPQPQPQNWFNVSVSSPLRSSSSLWEDPPTEQPQPIFYLPQDDDLFNFEQVHHPQHSHTKTQINTQLYKTELCASFMKTGVCPYASKCQFAHGESELKHVERPPKWRSKPCANWSKYGSCRYGNRCCFKHGD
ncbi:zinc finger-containing regulatory protein, putative [Candida dubliniensis CD36]|uniref:Zinc finger-containing regulatory protein, putative n=1 Tax=Candida dubliniensis (strain CD36 / ATCC MYA-646 / CBS 7987 / NCPF 3949 / NRRL Y-17841) TaxID=573826 RepID=B9WCY4_CANDC|nr:zinc finger-containing regulatory protein, putative [Candida dubliniensis CD36]CAX44259.1 zinc finger-containing regulatory protein, putative [Candida dubliniensis CD36]